MNWSPDGRELVFNDERFGTSIVPVDGGAPVAVGTTFGDPSWSPDGTRIVGNSFFDDGPATSVSRR